MRSPFDGLRMPRDLACEFFALFSRFEFALKELERYRRDQNGMAAPAWRAFGDAAGHRVRIALDSTLATAINTLTVRPPQVQLANGDWADQRLVGNTVIAQAIDASVRVRNNLFHGGKHSPHSPEGRDEELVRAALVVLKACLEADNELANLFDDRY